MVACLVLNFDTFHTVILGSHMEELANKLLGISLIAQEKLQATICSIPGKKYLVIENELIKPLEHVCSASWLKLKGIQRIFKFDSQHALQCDAEQVLLFMISSRLNSFEKTLQYIERQQNNESLSPTDIGYVKRYHIICVPNCYAYFPALLEAQGLYGTVQLHRFNWDFITIDKRVLSLEVPYIFPTVFLNTDTSALASIAQSLRVLQLICGRPELLITFGVHASNIARMMKAHGMPNNKKSNNDKGEASNAEKIDVMLIIDRDKDYASSLLTPSIYAGLLLEVFDYAAGELNIESDMNKILRQKLKLFQLEQLKNKSNAASSKNLKIKLSSANDEVYEENRYKHFTQVSGQIRAQAKAIGIEGQKLNDMKLEEMHEYVARKLPKITELKAKILRHLNASEKIIEMLAGNFQRIRSLEEDILNNVSRKRILQEIDELLTTDAQKYNTIRLLCLVHISIGLDPEELSTFIRNYCNYFGAKWLEVFQLLARGGLLPELLVEKPKKVSTTKLLSNLPIPKFQQTTFQANSNRLRLMTSSSTDALNESQSSVTSSTSSNASNENNTCPSYVFNGLYIPLIAQMCALIAKFSSTEDLGTKFNMLTDLELHVPDVATVFSPKTYANAVKQNDQRNIFPLRNAKIFVYVIGGLTYAEIAACNQIERITGAKIYVASDSIVAGSDIIGSAF